MKVIYYYALILILFVSGCLTESRQPSLLGGWERKSIRVGEKVVFPSSSQKYFFKDEATVVVSSTGEHSELNYETSYGLVKVSGKWLLIIEYPFRQVSVNGDTVTTFEVYELQEADSQSLVWRFITTGPCRDSTRVLPCKTYRTEYLNKFNWDTTGLGDTIPANRL